MNQCKQISFTPDENGDLVPCYRNSLMGAWIPCIPGNGDPPGGTKGLGHWHRLRKQGYEILELTR